MRTFDLFNNRDFGKEWDNNVLHNLGIEANQITNIKYGAISALLMSASAVVLQLIHYNQAVMFSLLTVPFLAWAIPSSVKEHNRKSYGRKLDHFEGMLAGIATTVTSISLFAIYLTWYFTINPRENPFFSPLMSACAVSVADTAVGIVISFIATEYQKEFN